MKLIIKAVLELLRILALLGIYAAISNYLINMIVRLLEISNGNVLVTTLNFPLLLVFIYWYRKKGQYDGWYPVKKKQ